MTEPDADDIEQGTRVHVDLSIRFEDVDEVVEGVVYRVDEDERRPYYIESYGRNFQVSEESIIGLSSTETAQDGDPA